MPDSKIAKFLPFKKESQLEEEVLLPPEAETVPETSLIEEPSSQPPLSKELEVQTDTPESVAPTPSEATATAPDQKTVQMPPSNNANPSDPTAPAQEETLTPNEQKNSEEVSQAIQAALGDEDTNQEEDAALLLAPGDTTITFSTIMPVAYTVNDIRVLSFNVDVELDAIKSAKLAKEATPIFEKIMVQTVEKFLLEKMKKEKKFYNDILYVREKLQRRLTLAFNKNMKGGRIKKVKFKEFVVK